MSEWTMQDGSHCPSPGCCNPDSDPGGNWCFVADPSCNGGNTWGYCYVDTEEPTPEPTMPFVAAREEATTTTLPSCTGRQTLLSMRLYTGNMYTDEISWRINNRCNSEGMEYGSNRYYDIYCCLAEKVYTLTCSDTWHDGWHGSYMEIDGETYCDDFTVGTSMEVMIAHGDVEIPTTTTEWSPMDFTSFPCSNMERLCVDSG
eukprot:UN25422